MDKQAGFCVLKLCTAHLVDDTGDLEVLLQVRCILQPQLRGHRESGYSTLIQHLHIRTFDAVQRVQAAYIFLGRHENVSDDSWGNDSKTVSDSFNHPPSYALCQRASKAAAGMHNYCPATYKWLGQPGASCPSKSYYIRSKHIFLLEATLPH